MTTTIRPKDRGKARDRRGRVTKTGRYLNINRAGKVGATAGFVVNAADDVAVCGRCPASQTNATLIVPIEGLVAGDRIQGGFLSGQIESAGNTATIRWQLRKQIAAAADPTDSQVTNMAAALSVTADTALSASNAALPEIDEEVLAGSTYYAVVTVTTAAATDVQVLALAILVLREPKAL